MLAAAALCLMLPAAPKDAYGAPGIETDSQRQPCSIQFDLGNLTGEGSEFEELAKLTVPVDIYQVADVKMDGSYALKDVYDGLSDHLKTALEAANVQDEEYKETKAAEWEALAEGIKALIPEGTEGDQTVRLTAGTGTTEDLTVGLYLVSARTVWSEEYIYTFSPYLISVPDNRYYDTGNDAWIYDVPVSLKAARENRFGDLEIVKTLNSYNVSLGDAAFVFRVQAEKDGIICDEVVSLVFDGPGTRSVRVAGKIPAGARAVVTEVYSGASYSAVGNEIYTIENILAARMPEETGEAVINQASFTNTYDDRLNVGTSIVNHFEYVEGRAGGPWEWSRQADSSEGE